MADEELVLTIACRENDNSTVTSSTASPNIKAFINNKVPAEKIPCLTKDVEFTTALQQACGHASFDIVKQLVQAGADVTIVDGYKNSPLHRACYSDTDRRSKVQFLLDCDKSMVHARNKYDDLPIHLAALYDHGDLIDMLVKAGGDVNAKGQDSRTAVHSAAQNGHNRCIHVLVAHKADVNATDKNGALPLHIASAFGQADTVNYLLRIYKCDVNATDKYGYTPLHRAARDGQKSVIETLTSYPGCKLNTTNNDGKTARDLAREKKHKEIAFYLANLHENSAE